jgi:predicted O-methyltransferase YrrM
MSNYEGQYPAAYQAINQATLKAGFTMASDVETCSLLRTLAASKPSGKFLELGTGTGLSASWILDGMDNLSTLTSIDNNPTLLSIAQSNLIDNRLKLVCSDGGEWIESNKELKFDFIFADTWHGKYIMLDETLSMLNKGAIYILDDMLPQTNWPDGHAEKAVRLMLDLENRNDITITKQNWSTGIIIATKNSCS